MSYDRGQGRDHGHEAANSAAPASKPSKIGGSTLVQALGGNMAAPASKVGGSSLAGQLGGGTGSGSSIQEVAAMGITGTGGPLPHGDSIQRAFGRHDVSGIQAHTGGGAETATRALGAEAYATGQHVAFGGQPSLHTAAHEAAHVVQQRAGIQLKGGVGMAGDPHEQHADAVADLVVQGRSAEGLLDGYGQGSGSGAAAGVQRKGTETPSAEAAPPRAEAAPSVDTHAIIQKLDRMLLPIFFGITEGTFEVDGITSWMEHFTQTIGEARTAAAGTSPPELVQAVDRCVALCGSEIRQVAEEIRAATVQLTNDSSVSKKDPAKAVFPTQAQVKQFGGAAAKFNELSRDAALPAGPDTKATLQSIGTTAQDATLAMLQSLSVVSARDRWTTGTSTETPSADKAGTGPRTEIDEIFKDAGWANRVQTYTTDSGKKRVFDWCGMFVVSSYWKGAGMAKQLRAGFYHTDNVQDFFNYAQAHNAGRIPMSIWAENQWWNLKEFHKARGSLRQWTPRATVQAALAAGGTGDIRPGDTCLIDHKGGNSPSHIVMVESYDPVTKQLVTIEGNTFGIHADKDGKAERLDDDHLKKSTQGSGTATGLHVRDMRQLAPGPGQYVVTNAQATVREDEDLTRYKKEDGKNVVIPVDTTVEVTELQDVGGAKYAKVTDWGWTKFTNLGTSGKPPTGGYKAAGGATVWGVGRPSLVDFEDGHEYAVNQVPAELQTTSPTEMHELAKHKDKTGAAVRKLDLK
jgi:hypothetical protein